MVSPRWPARRSPCNSRMWRRRACLLAHAPTVVSRTVARARRKTGVVLRQAACQLHTSAADASAAFALHVDWLDGANSSVAPIVTLLPDDVLQITLSGAAGGPTLGFFELCAVEDALAALGFDSAGAVNVLRRRGPRRMRREGTVTWSPDGNLLRWQARLPVSPDQGDDATW